MSVIRIKIEAQCSCVRDAYASGYGAPPHQHMLYFFACLLLLVHAIDWQNSCTAVAISSSEHFACLASGTIQSTASLAASCVPSLGHPVVSKKMRRSPSSHFLGDYWMAVCAAKTRILQFQYSEDGDEASTGHTRRTGRNVGATDSGGRRRQGICI